MFMICGRTSFYVVDEVNGFINVITAGTKRKATDVQDLLYKTYKWVLDNYYTLINCDFVNKFVETGISVYDIGTPEIYINPARCETYEEQLFEFINLKFRLFGYMFITPQEALGLEE